MGTQANLVRPAVTAKDVRVVLAVARTHRDTAARLPASWEATMAQMRALLAEHAANGPADRPDQPSRDRQTNA